jgi:hypothetical protein
MIRDKRTFIVINAVGAACALFVLVSWTVSPPTHALFPPWFLMADGALLLGYFIYNIVRRLRGPIQPARWARNMTDRQLWTLKGLVMVILVGVAFAIIFIRVPHP